MKREVRPFDEKGFFLSSCALPLFARAAGARRAREVYEIKVHGVIGPPVAQFISESITRSADARAEALLILLDTPGGLDTAMRDIVKAIMEAPVPVIVYVYPSGARAASAGAIILLAAHVAAMAPGTNVGAAHPVTIGKEKLDKEMMAKVVQDAEAYAKSLAKKRGRNAEWAGQGGDAERLHHGGRGPEGPRHRRGRGQRGRASLGGGRKSRGGGRREGHAARRRARSSGDRDAFQVQAPLLSSAIRTSPISS